MELPMDVQGGEKADNISCMLGCLATKSQEHPNFIEDWYYLSDSTLAAINLLQGFNALVRLDGSRIKHGFMVWSQAPGPARDAILQANGFAPIHEPLHPGILIFIDQGL